MNFKHILTILFLSLAFIAQAQKFGHLNATALLVELAEVKAADTQLASISKTLEADYTGQIAEFDAEYNKLVEKANSKEYTQLQIERDQAALAKKQEDIKKFELVIQQQLQQKREELYAPILKKVDDAIKAVGAENSFTMIFDTSSGFILHGQESEDITALVKAKM
ncbi:OmpH family outer membrane protein [Saprospiraceae bacterium]|nr:OmpH family outer membrane protein [Saprospiraceae bacterium]